MLKQLRVVGLVVVMAACGSDSPAEKCDTLVDVTCDRAVECLPGAGTHTQCVQEVQTVIACGSAVRVSPSYGRCLDQIDSAACSILFPNGQLDLPADCDGVILTSRVATEDGTNALTRGALELVEPGN